MSRSTRIEYADYACMAGHYFRAASRISFEPHSHLEQFYRVNDGPWLPIAKCPFPGCLLIGDPNSDIRARDFAQVPESERFEGYLAPDGSAISVPGEKGKPMPERYRRAGYIRVQAHNLRDLDRFDRIRARQTGNHAYNEMNYSAAHRRERDQADYNDDLNSEV